MGVVAKFGVSGVPFAGKRPVRSSITLAEIRAGNSNLGPESPEEPVSTQGFLPNDYPAPEAPTTQPTTNLTNDYPTYGPSITSELPIMSQGQNALSDSLPPQVIPTPEVKQSGQNLKLQMPPNPAMSTNYHPQNPQMSPNHLPKQASPQKSPVTPNFPPPPPLSSSERVPKLKPAQERQLSKTVRSPQPEPEPEQFWQKLGTPSPSKASPGLNVNLAQSPPSSFDQSLNEFEAQRDLMMSPRILPEAAKSQTDGRPFPPMSPARVLPEEGRPFPPTALSQPLEPVNTPPPAPASLLQSEGHQDLSKTNPDFVDGGRVALTACPRKETSEEIKINNGLDQLSAKEGDAVAEGKLNDDIKLSKPRERSVPRQQSLQKEFEGHSRPHQPIQHPFAAESQKSPARGIQAQKSMSVDNDEAEMMEISNKTGRRDSNSVRYRPSTPRTVTPVRFTPTPKLPNKGWKSPDVKPDEPRTAPINLEREEKKTRGEASEEAKLRSQGPSRNVSDSGISVESSEPDEISGKIITDQMQKIEAQMKKILSAEKPKVPEPVRVDPTSESRVETSESASSLNIDSERPSVDRVEMSGYSTCSEEELKFDDSLKINNTSGGKSSTETPVRTGSFEAMEEFEEAPEEFDLGITSYSISHPNEVEEVEKTPVPEVFDSNKPMFEEETPYRVSPPESMYGTLEHDRRATHLQKPVQQENNGFGLQNPMHSPFIQDHNSLFNGANMMSNMMPNMMPGMAPFPQQLPNMFEQDFFSPPAFPHPAPPTFPSSASAQCNFPSSASSASNAFDKASTSGERIIPIQVKMKKETISQGNN